MAANSQDQPETIPGTVFGPRQVRALKIAVIVMGLLLVGGFALVLGTIVYQASRGDESRRAVRPATVAVPPGAERELRLAPGESIAHIALDGNRLAVHVKGPQGAEIRVLDLATGALVGRVRLKSE